MTTFPLLYLVYPITAGVKSKRMFDGILREDREAGVPEGNIFMDKQSGKDFNRPGYRRALRKLPPGTVSRDGVSEPSFVK